MKTSKKIEDKGVKVKRTSKGMGVRVGRKDGYFELPWYKGMKHLATKANQGRGYDVVLVGPAGCGKTVGGYMLATDLGFGIELVQCHRRIEVEDFKGTRSIVSGKDGSPITGFDPGSLTRALYRCRKEKGIVLIIDEINLVDPSMLAILNNMTQKDEHSELVITETGETLVRPRNLLIVGTMNPDYIGTNALSEAFTSRVVKFECPMMTMDMVKKILLKAYPGEGTRATVVAQTMGYVESGRKHNTHQWEPDIRTMQQLLDLWLFLEPEWKRGLPLTVYAEAVDSVVGPKIGWHGTYYAVRKGLVDGIVTSLGGKLAENGGDSNVQLMSDFVMTDDD